MVKQTSMKGAFESDAVAEYQYFRVFRARAYDIPEERLMVAVLNDAVECLAKFRGGKSRGDWRLFHEARDWVLSGECDEIFSFENICDTLEIDANYLRRGLRPWLGDSPEKMQRVKVWRTPLRYGNRVLDFQIAS